MWYGSTMPPRETNTLHYKGKETGATSSCSSMFLFLYLTGPVQVPGKQADPRLPRCPGNDVPAHVWGSHTHPEDGYVDPRAQKIFHCFARRDILGDDCKSCSMLITNNWLLPSCRLPLEGPNALLLATSHNLQSVFKPHVFSQSPPNSKVMWCATWDLGKELGKEEFSISCRHLVIRRNTNASNFTRATEVRKLHNSLWPWRRSLGKWKWLASRGIGCFTKCR